MTYIYTAVLVVLLGLGVFARIEFSEISSLKKDNEKQSLLISFTQKQLADEQKKEAEEAVRRGDYEKKIEDNQHEIDTLRTNIDSGTQRLYIHAKCPSMPQAAPNAARAEAAKAELDTSARQDYYTLRAGIQKLEADYIYCQNELDARSK